ncbi:hypothetical protein TNCV_2116521 [Trichonephila clavipes]|nr:hypothetical protein TNCV_2116521 [Trichonephila clavipes]
MRRFGSLLGFLVSSLIAGDPNMIWGQGRSYRRISRINNMGPHATGAPTCVSTVSCVSTVPHLRKCPKGILIQGPLRVSYASVWDPL